MTGLIDWAALGNVVGVGLLVGAGLPALFALGVRALDGEGARDAAGVRRPGRVLAATACFAVVVGALITAIALLALGS